MLKKMITNVNTFIIIIIIIILESVVVVVLSSIGLYSIFLIIERKLY
jgi:hypothetical protein